MGGVCIDRGSEWGEFVATGVRWSYPRCRAECFIFPARRVPSAKHSEQVSVAKRKQRGRERERKWHKHKTNASGKGGEGSSNRFSRQKVVNEMTRAKDVNQASERFYYFHHHILCLSGQCFPPPREIACVSFVGLFLFVSSPLPSSCTWCTLVLTLVRCTLPSPYNPCYQAKVGKDADNQTKQRALVDVLLPLQLQVAKDNGFDGEEGYIQLQTLLMHHSSDDAVSYNTMSGTMAVFRRAGIQFG